MKILALESSCDETAAAVVENGRTVLSSRIHSQAAEHKLYGGVVPEIASRRHVENIGALTELALADAGLSLPEIDAVAVTCAPGLIGALLVGVNFAKGLALSAGKPLIPVHHIRGHIAANYLAHPDLEPPFLALVVSGGHTVIACADSYTQYRILSTTVDDAAGEAFDKVARVLDYPYPGGIYIDKAAAQGDPKAYPLPIPAVENRPDDFSFSGLKTAVINIVHNAQQKNLPVCREDLAAGFQATAVRMLTERFFDMARRVGAERLVVAGGVAANSGLRRALEQRAEREGYRLYIPPVSLCGDNAAMIGSQAWYEYLDGVTAGCDLNACAYVPLDIGTAPCYNA